MKRYLATIGPMVACFTVHEDFFYYTGVYRYHKNTRDFRRRAPRAVVGYDDAAQCWIAKNSWGTGWGEDGCFRIGYGVTGIDAEMWASTGRSPLVRKTCRWCSQARATSGGRNAAAAAPGRGSPETADTGTPGDPGTVTAVTAAATINRLHVLALVGARRGTPAAAPEPGQANGRNRGRPARPGRAPRPRSVARRRRRAARSPSPGERWHTWRTASGTSAGGVDAGGRRDRHAGAVHRPELRGGRHDGDGGRHRRGFAVAGPPEGHRP